MERTMQSTAFRTFGSVRFTFLLGFVLWHSAEQQGSSSGNLLEVLRRRDQTGTTEADEASFRTGPKN
jgi:hypothetical protein